MPILNYNHDCIILDLWNYLQELHKLVGSLYQRMSKIQDNLVEIKAVMSTWSSQPLFERKDGKKVNNTFLIHTCMCTTRNKNNFH